MVRLADAALAGSCASFVLLPTVGQLLTDGEGFGAGPTSPIQPPGYAFGVWFPIFALAATDTVARVREPHPDDEATRWPLIAAYAGNAAWAVLFQTGRHRATPVALATAAASSAVAVRRLQRRADARRTSSVTAGLLLGWTTLATAVNVSAEARRGGPDAAGERATPLDLAAQAAAGAALVTLLRDSSPASRAAATSATWGLATTSLTSARPTAVRAVAAGVALAVQRVWRRG